MNPAIKILAEQINARSDAKDRLDAGEVAVLGKALEDMRSRVYEDDYTLIKARQFIPVSNDVDPGAETFAYEEQAHVGEAKIISNYSDDPPSAEVESRKVILPIVGVGGSYHYSLMDLRRAAKAGTPLTARKARAARDVWERRLDSIAASGAGDQNVGGFINSTNVTAANAATGTWSGATPAQIVADVNGASAAMITASDENFEPNTLLVPTAQFLILAQTRMSADNSESIRQAILGSNPWLTDIQPWNVLAGAGAGSTDRAVLYRKDPGVCELIIPQDFEVLPPQADNFAFKVLTHGRTGGTAVYKPLGMRYMDAI